MYLQVPAKRWKKRCKAVGLQQTETAVCHCRVSPCLWPIGSGFEFAGPLPLKCPLAQFILFVILNSNALLGLSVLFLLLRLQGHLRLWGGALEARECVWVCWLKAVRLRKSSQLQVALSGFEVTPVYQG